MASVSKREWEHKGVKKSAWVVRYVDQGGKHRSKQFDKKTDASAFRSKVETELNSGLHAAEAQKKTINFVADEFLRHMHQRQRAGEIGITYLMRVEADIRRKIRPNIGNMKMGEVKLGVLSDWYYKMIADGQSPRTARIATMSMKMIFDHAIRREWVLTNPATILLKETRGSGSAPIKTFTKEQIMHLLEVLAQPMYRGRRPRSNLRMQCFVNIAVFCGLRIGEINALKVENVDLENRIIKVRHSLSKYDGLKGPKSRAGIRDVGMPQHVVELLQGWMDHFSVANPDQLIFTKPCGKAMHIEGFHAAWGRLLHRAGLSDNPTKPTFHFHALRHFAASWRVHEGVPLPIVAKEMGHRKVDMTLSVYTHALEHGTGTAEAAQALSDSLITSPKIVIPVPIAQELRIEV